MTNQNDIPAHLRGPWVYAPPSEEGSAVVSPPPDDDSVKVWWTAIIDCADDDVANDIARLIAAATETAAELDRLKAINGDLVKALRAARDVFAQESDDAESAEDSEREAWASAQVSAIDAAISRATGDAT